MRRWSVGLILTIGAVGSAAMAQSGRSPDDQAALRTQRAWLQAYADGDESALEKLLKPDFQLVTSNGELNGKTSLIDVAKSPPAVLTLTASEIRVRQEANVALVTSKVLEKRAGGTVEFRVTDVLMRSSGRWQIASSHWTRTTGDLSEASVSTADLDRLTGAYRTPRGVPLRVSRRGQRLQVTEVNGQSTDLLPLSQTMFAAPGGRVRWLFIVEPSGEVGHAVVANLNALTPLVRDSARQGLDK